MNVRAHNAHIMFYDIESLRNAFTVAVYTPKLQRVDLFYLLDDIDPSDVKVHTLKDTIIEKNPIMDVDKENIRIHNLATPKGMAALTRCMLTSDASGGWNSAVNSKQGKLNSQILYLNREHKPVYAQNPMCDTHKDFSPATNYQHYYLAGYNSYQYDTTMLAIVFDLYHRKMDQIHKAIHSQGPKTPAPLKEEILNLYYNNRLIASEIREHNDALFTREYKSYMPSYLISSKDFDGFGSRANIIRSNMLQTGRHFDVARLNEKQVRVGLKRLVGSLGYQILESDKLSGPSAQLDSVEDFYELAAYNVSDVVGLSKLFEHPAYANAFDLKMGLMEEYPETVYNRDGQEPKPRVSTSNVRRNRLSVDSTSARFVSTILAPYKALNDQEVVDLHYPSKERAKELGCESVDVLERAREFFYNNISDEAARKEFDKVYTYYSNIRGKNFNESEEYAEHYQVKGEDGFAVLPYPPHQMSEYGKSPGIIPYYDHKGKPLSTFVNFSIGGIHGAEYDIEKLEYDRSCLAKKVEQFNRNLAMVKAAWPDATEMRSHCKDNKGKSQFVPDPDGGILDEENGGIYHKDVLVPGSTISGGSTYKEPMTVASLSHVSTTTRVKPDGQKVEIAKLKGAYVKTSIDRVLHEDFSSYYPNMLNNLNAFYNADLGENRYAKIYQDKERYGKLMKDPSLSPEERESYTLLRQGTKLILNSASGAGDALTPNNIRMNNRIISMRIIGQLMTWMVGQYQTLAPSKTPVRVTSTNTDGLYITGLDDEEAIKRLKEQEKFVRVDIEPHPMLLVSKDSNNRVEIAEPKGGDLWNTTILSASGALACWDGPNPEKSLAHPAVIDYVLVRYLALIAQGYEYEGSRLDIRDPFNRDLAKKILIELHETSSLRHLALMYQNIINASPGVHSFPFAYTGEEPTRENVQMLQHQTRTFVAKEGTDGACHMMRAQASKITEASAKKREADGANPVQDNHIAALILEHNGYSRKKRLVEQGFEEIPNTKDVKIGKITGVDPKWNIVINNQDLNYLDSTDKLKTLIDSLDTEVYLDMIETSYENSWRNASVSNQGSNCGETPQEEV